LASSALKKEKKKKNWPSASSAGLVGRGDEIKKERKRKFIL
jgi:hypothetical protein